MSLETSLDLEEDIKAFNYDYDEKVSEETKDLKDDSVDDLVETKGVKEESIFGGLGGFLEENYSLLFFFLILVIIFNGSGTLSESNESLLFFFLILVILYNQFY